ncbi:MAG: GvpL/GvpF family gas vesicle protein, partial [Terracidiphilus sp.]
GKMLLDVAHLIDRKCVERYQNKFTSTSALMRECHMQLSGPWPPYHFVHRLTRPAHAQTPAPVQPSHAPETPAIALMEPSPVFV